MTMSGAESENAQLTGEELEVILTEYRSLREEIRMFVGFHRRDTQLVLAVAAALGSLSLVTPQVQGPRLLYAVLPTVLFVYYMLQLVNVRVASLEAKHCARIEMQLNDAFQLCLMDWEYQGSHTRRRLSPELFGMGSLVALGLAGDAVLVVAGWGHVPRLLVALHLMELALMLLMTALTAYGEWGKERLETVPREWPNASSSSGLDPR